MPLFIVVPLFCALLTALAAKYYKVAGDIIACVSALALLVLSVMALMELKGLEFVPLVSSPGGWKFPLGIALVIDAFSAVMLILVNFIALLITVYSIPYMERYTDKWKYWSLLLLLIAGLNGVLVSGDIFSMYVFLELSSLSCYSLIAFGCEIDDLEASFRYMVMGSIASLFILLGIGIIYSSASALNMADISLKVAGSKGPVIPFVTILFLMGFGLKAALVPFHSWLADAHPSAPAPISAMLSGVVIKVLGIYAMARLFFNVLGVAG